MALGMLLVPSEGSVAGCRALHVAGVVALSWSGGTSTTAPISEPLRGQPTIPSMPRSSPLSGGESVT
jgi:hypothetical protein